VLAFALCAVDRTAVSTRGFGASLYQLQELDELALAGQYQPMQSVILFHRRYVSASLRPNVLGNGRDFGAAVCAGQGRAGAIV